MGFFSLTTVREAFSSLVTSRRSLTKAGAVGVAAAMLATGVAAVPASADIQDATGMTCTPVHVIYAKGTGNSDVNQSGDISEALEGFDLYNTIADRIGHENVSGYSIPYPASLGTISAFYQAALADRGGYVGGGTATIPYGESVRMGVQAGIDHVSAYEAACPTLAILSVAIRRVRMSLAISRRAFPTI